MAMKDIYARIENMTMNKSYDTELTTSVTYRAGKEKLSPGMAETKTK